MAIPIINSWQHYFEHPDEGLGSSYERVILNQILQQIYEDYRIETILETPAFGFTGLSGINLLQAAQNGLKVSLEDDNPQRLDLIKDLWQELGLELNTRLNPGFAKLEYPDAAFDMSFNFSAMWFVENLQSFLSELSRVTRKLIFISVPNRSGIGYRGQIKDYSPEAYPMLKPAFIDPASIGWHLNKLGWKMVRNAYFDCPLWPDIGMSKEDFLMRYCMICKILGKCKVPLNRARKVPLCIMNHYRGNDPDFPLRMQRYRAFEDYAPLGFKKVWAHHYYMVFVPAENA